FNIRDLTTAKEFANKNKELIETTGAPIIVSDCPGCIITLTNRYQKVGINVEKEILHITQYFKKLLDNGDLCFTNNIPEEYRKITIHDPCLIVRNLKDTESIRAVLNEIPDLEIIEPIFNKEYVHCCGWSGTAHWADKDLAIREAQNRINELKETETNIILSACPLCELGLGYGIEDTEKEKYKILDISELLIKLL
ncbi:MAG: (Fe-S)-binding protein, partial [Promethearchaeota archaeon]